MTIAGKLQNHQSSGKKRQNHQSMKPQSTGGKQPPGSWICRSCSSFLCCNKNNIVRILDFFVWLLFRVNWGQKNTKPLGKLATRKCQTVCLWKYPKLFHFSPRNRFGDHVLQLIFFYISLSLQASTSRCPFRCFLQHLLMAWWLDSNFLMTYSVTLEHILCPFLAPLIWS